MQLGDHIGEFGHGWHLLQQIDKFADKEVLAGVFGQYTNGDRSRNIIRNDGVQSLCRKVFPDCLSLTFGCDIYLSRAG